MTWKKITKRITQGKAAFHPMKKILCKSDNEFESQTMSVWMFYTAQTIVYIF